MIARQGCLLPNTKFYADSASAPVPKRAGGPSGVEKLAAAG